MKKIFNSKVVLVILIALVGISLFSTFVNATDNNGLNLISDPNAPVNNTPVNNTPVNNTPVNNTPVNNTPVNNTPVKNTPATNIYTPTNTTKLPQTGIEDYALWLIIPVCIVSALYAFKKIRDYNV